MSHKRQACDLVGANYGTTPTWTEGAACALGGSLGHCTDAVANVYNPVSQALTGAMDGVWSVP